MKKKIFAVLLLSLLAFSLVSCVLGGYSSYNDTDIPSCKDDEDGIEYTPLDIDVIAFAAESETDTAKMQYELQVGMRLFDSPDLGSYEDSTGKMIGSLIDRKTAVDFEYCGALSGEEDFVRYCFLSEPVAYALDEMDGDFGFFTIKRKVALRNPDFVNELGTIVRDAAKTALGSLYGGKAKIDDGAIRSRFYFAVSDAFRSSDATEDVRFINSRYGEARCLKWEQDNFSTLYLEYRAMASGWFIVPVVAGIAVVAILLFVVKDKKQENVFLVEDRKQDVSDEVKTEIEPQTSEDDNAE